MEWRSLGQTDYPTSFPLREVLMLAKRCAGGLILGFKQFETKNGIWKKGTPFQSIQRALLKLPTPWNHIEAGILFSLDLPLLVFREDGVAGGIFDNGVSDLFVQNLPIGRSHKRDRKVIKEVIRKWSVRVHSHYYEE